MFSMTKEYLGEIESVVRTQLTAMSPEEKLDYLTDIFFLTEEIRHELAETCYEMQENKSLAIRTYDPERSGDNTWEGSSNGETHGDCE